MPDPSNKSLLFIGMSHVIAIRTANEKQPRPGVEVLRIPTEKSVKNTGQAYPAFDIESGKILPDKLGNPNPDVVVLCLSGNEHNVYALFEHPEKFALVTADGRVDDDIDDRTFVPSSVFKDLVLARRVANREMTQDIAALFPKAQIVQMLPPPPMEDGEALRNMKDMDPKLEEAFKSGIGPDATRLAAYEIGIEVIKDEVRAHDALIVEPHPDALTKAGFLKAELCDNPTHGNAVYGQMMLDKIQKEVRAA